MNRIFMIPVFTLIFFCQSSKGQEVTADCYTVNEAQYARFSVKTIKDLRLRKMLAPFFELTDTDFSHNFFIDLKPQFANDSAAYFRIEKGGAKGYEIRMETRQFNQDKHKLTLSNIGEVCLIDNKIFWGTDGTLPIEEIKKFEVYFNHSKIGMPLSEFRDIYNPVTGFPGHILNLHAKMDRKGEYFIIVLFGSDGAGSYSAIWIFKNGKYLRRIVESVC